MQTIAGDVQYCKSCGYPGSGKFCNNCGQSYQIKRITVKSLLHDVFHFFTHLEKGFGYTVKRLITAPGTMQREYVEGMRSRYQKPFSLFFICASVNAIMRYWVEELLMKYYQRGSNAEASLRHEYQLLLMLLLIPVITLFTRALFSKNKYNYAETGVFQLYMVSFALLASALIAPLRFVWSGLDTAFIEFPLFLVYNVITSVHFYNTSKRVVVIIKSIVLTIVFFWMIQYMEDFTLALLAGRNG